MKNIKEKNVDNEDVSNIEKQNNDNIIEKRKNKKVLSIIALVLLVIIIFIIVLLKIVNLRGLAIDTEKYTKLEKYLEDKTKNLYDDEYFLFENSTESWIRTDKLVSNNVIKQDELDDCKGYVVISVDEDGKKSYKSYIKCSYKYKTKGYDKEKSKKGKLSAYGQNIYFYKLSDDKNKIISSDSKKKDNSLYGEYVGKYKCNKILCSEEKEFSTKPISVVTHNDRYIIINDESKISIYDYKENKKIDTNIEFSSEIEDVKSNDKYYGIIIKSKEKSILYSIKDNKILFETKGSISIPNQEYVNRGYIVIKNEDLSSELLNLNTLKIKENSKIESSIYGYSDEYKMPIVLYADATDLLDSNMNRVFNKMYFPILYVDNLICAYEQNTNEYKIFNKDNEKVEVKNTNYPILGLVKNYIVVNKNGIVTLTDYNNNVIKEIFSLGSNRYDAFMSGYYDAHDNHPSGLYLVFSNTSGTECFEYYFNENTKVATKYSMDHCGSYGKPVLYLYPKKKMTVTVDFEKEENLTTTYPKFKDKWKVVANPNGDLYDKNGKYYYGLYWEETLNHKVDFSSGFYVTKDDAIDFLEEKLSYIGLNDKERNEFIMYWLPILEKNEKNLVYFELTKERDSYNKLIINPKPDSLLRVAIHIKKVSEKVNIKKQKLEKFERKGFTAVEWGGINY